MIEDDGTGFDPEPSAGEGIGLLGMRERIELLDGTLTVESSECSGTTLVAEVPLDDIRVLIVDDHAVVRSGLRLLLEAEDDIEAVGEAGIAREAIFEARSRSRT